jgi:adenylyltransferase/sulfurtransferase
VEALVSDAELILDCLDKLPCRRCSTLAVRRSLHDPGSPGCPGRSPSCTPPATACLACVVPQSPPQEVFPILGATAGLLGCLQALEALKYLAGGGPLLVGRMLFCDGQAMQFQEVALSRDPRCPVCGGR